MDKKNFRELLFISFLVLLLGACKVTAPYQSPGVSATGLYRDINTADTNTIATIPWRQVFTDTILQRLIDEGIRQNLNLQIAYSRIQQSEAYYAQSTAAYFPTLNANVQAGVGKVSTVQGGNSARTGGTQFLAGLNASWEANIWGRLGSAKRSAFASLLQTEAGARTVQTGLMATIASYY